MKSKKAQIAMEFIMVMGAVMFFMTIFFMMVQNSTEEKMYKREYLMVEEIALTVQNEINLASSSVDGYSRNFSIPNKAGNLDYEINTTSGVVYIRTTNNKHALTFPIQKINGDINISDNTIQKINGEVFLNK